MFKEKGPRRVNYVWVLAGGYLGYLGIKILVEMIKGTAVTAVWKYLVSIIFIIIGVYLLIREWLLYRHGSKDEELYRDDVPEDFYDNISDDFEKELEAEKFKKDL